MKFKLIFSLVVLLLTGCIDLAANDGKDKQAYLQKLPKTKAQVYTMRGGLGGIFSKGMNRLQNALKKDKRLYVSSTVWYKSGELSQFIIDNQKTGKAHGPIVLVGHSLGANEQIQVAKALYWANIPVALLITVDAVYPLTVPPNVKQVVNIYKPSFVPMFSGLQLEAVDPAYTKLNNVNVDAVSSMHVNHFTIDGNQATQNMMLNEIHQALNKVIKKK